jgi:hypothetical protein
MARLGFLAKWRPIAMLRHSSVRVALSAIALGALVTQCAAQAPVGAPPIVRQIDHIRIAASAARELFELLSVTLRLPVVWPMADYGGFASGGVAAGNVNLEIVKDTAAAEEAAKSRWTGFALEPAPLETCLRELDARGIPHGAAAPFRKWELGKFPTTLWKTVSLPTVSSDACEVFLCEYAENVAVRRQRLLKELESRDGGPLGIRSVREIVLGARDVARARAAWQKLLDPTEGTAAGVWPVGGGPAIRVVQADKDGIDGLVIEVKSLPARLFLKSIELFGSDGPSEVTLGGSQLEGLHVTLVEPAEGGE